MQIIIIGKATHQNYTKFTYLHTYNVQTCMENLSILIPQIRNSESNSVFFFLLLCLTVYFVVACCYYKKTNLVLANAKKLVNYNISKLLFE